MSVKIRVVDSDEEHLGGQGFSPSVAQKMIKGFAENPASFRAIEEKGVLAVSFDKEEIMRILKHKECEGIRCYLVQTELRFNESTKKCEKINRDGSTKPSILIVGIDDEGNDLIYKFKSGKFFAPCTECGTDCECKKSQETNKIEGCDSRLGLLNGDF